MRHCFMTTPWHPPPPGTSRAITRPKPPQALFRKIAAALPGMEAGAGGGGRGEDLVNVQLAPATVQLTAGPSQQQASSCSC